MKLEIKKKIEENNFLFVKMMIILKIKLE